MSLTSSFDQNTVVLVFKYTLDVLFKVNSYINIYDLVDSLIKQYRPNVVHILKPFTTPELRLVQYFLFQNVYGDFKNNLKPFTRYETAVNSKRFNCTNMHHANVGTNPVDYFTENFITRYEIPSPHLPLFPTRSV